MTEDINEMDIITTTERLTDEIPEGTRGIVHQVYVTQPKVYLVEMIDEEDVTIAIVEVREDYIALESRSERACLHVGRHP